MLPTLLRTILSDNLQLVTSASNVVWPLTNIGRKTWNYYNSSLWIDNNGDNMLFWQTYVKKLSEKTTIFRL